MAYNAAAVANGVIAYQKPITLQQGRALRDNPIEMAGGAAGAPRVAPLAMAGGQMLPRAVAGGSPAVITGLSLVADLGGFAIMDVSGGASTLKVDLSSNGGSSYAAQTTIYSGGALIAFDLVSFNLITGVYQFSAYTGTIALPAGTIDTIRFSVVGGSFVLTPMILGGKP